MGEVIPFPGRARLTDTQHRTQMKPDIAALPIHRPGSPSWDEAASRAQREQERQRRNEEFTKLLAAQWRFSDRGNPTVVYHGVRITIFRHAEKYNYAVTPALWDQPTKPPIFFGCGYKTERTAKRYCLNAFLWMRKRYGYTTPDLSR